MFGGFLFACFALAVLGLHCGTRVVSSYGTQAVVVQRHVGS